MNGFIEAKKDGRRILLRTAEILRIEETETGNALIHVDNWENEPLVLETSFEEFSNAVQNDGAAKQAV